MFLVCKTSKIYTLPRQTQDIELINISIRILHANLKMYRKYGTFAHAHVSPLQLCTFWPPGSLNSRLLSFESHRNYLQGAIATTCIYKMSRSAKIFEETQEPATATILKEPKKRRFPKFDCMDLKGCWVWRESRLQAAAAAPGDVCSSEQRQHERSLPQVASINSIKCPTIADNKPLDYMHLAGNCRIRHE